jgi:hypothetical protein
LGVTITVNPDLNLVVEQPLSRLPLAVVKLPRGSKVPIWVQFARDGAVIDPSEALTSGTLVVGLYYKITAFVAGDSFTNVGAASNATSVYFLCTGTTPTTWTNSSTLEQCDSAGVLFSLIFSVKKHREYDGAVLVLASGTDFTKFGTGTSTIFKSKCSFSTAEINTLLGVDASAGNDESEVTLMGEASWLGPDESKAFPFQIDLQNDSYKVNDVVTSTPGVQAMSLVTTSTEALLTGSHAITGSSTVTVTPTTGLVTLSVPSELVVPSQTGNSGKYLTTNGTVTSWGAVTGGVTSITGTANEITVTGTTTPTLSLPSAMTFTDKTVTGGTFTGGAFNGTVGATTPTTGVFTGLTVNDNSTLGSSNADTVNFQARVASDINPATDNTYDLGVTGHEWRNLNIDGTANIDSLVADTADIDGGTIDATAIGATTPAAGSFTTLTASATTSLLLGTAGSAVGAIGFNNADSGTTTLAPATGALGTGTVTLPLSGTLATLEGTETLTNKRITPRVGSTTSSATPTINTDNVDRYDLTAQAADITSFTSNLSGTPTNGQALWISIKGTAARAITWGASFENGAATLPTTTVSTDRLDVLFVWNAVTSKWRCTLTTVAAGLSDAPSNGHPYARKDGAWARLEDSVLYLATFATNVTSIAGWTVTGDTPALVGTDVKFANPGSVTEISAAADFDTGATLDFSVLTGLTSIGSNAFYGQSNLTGALVLPDSLTTIGSNAFSGCSGLTGDLTIPSSVTSIDSNAFRGCSSFSGYLTIPSSVTSIGGGVFENCTGFYGDLVIPSSVTSIGGYAFAGCSGFTGTLTIPSGVTDISYAAFRYCDGFTGDLTIPSSVTNISSYAFYYCSGFTGTLTIPSSVTSIDIYTFAGCSSLGVTLTIPSSVTSIGNYAFENCSGLTTVNAYVALSVIDVPGALLGTGVTDIHARASDGTWTAGAGQTIGGKTGITVTKDL